MEEYLDVLKEELTFTKRRYQRAGQQNKKLLEKWIRQIERDIRRYSTESEAGLDNMDQMPKA